MDYDDLTDREQITSLRTCYSISVVDDLLVEGTEVLNVTGSITGSSLDLTFDPEVTRVLIEDDGNN